MKTNLEVISPSELFADVAARRLGAAVAHCDLMKATAEAQVAMLLRGRARGSQNHRDRMRLAKAVVAAGFKAQGLNSRGGVRKLQRHPDLAGLNRKDYSAALCRRRRADLYARGLTCRGTARILMVNTFQ